MTAEKSSSSKKLDYKKEYKDLYVPKTNPSIISVPPMNFIMVEGTGDPNAEDGLYAQALEVLYGLSYSIKMSKMGNHVPEGYFEYVVPPLEGLWWLEGYNFSGIPIENKNEFRWIAMIRQPEFVTTEVFQWAQETVVKKNPAIAAFNARFELFEEGLCAQIMHQGPYDDEPATIKKLVGFIQKEGYVEDISGQLDAFPLQRRHHEIYLGDPRRTKPEKLKTVLRHPVKLA